MNILMLTTYAHGGAGIACRRLQLALQESGEQAGLLTIAQMPNKWPFYLERLSFLPYERDKSVRFSFSLANVGYDLSRRQDVQQADILHLHWINQGFLSLSNIRRLGALDKPIVWTLHDMWAFTGGCHYSGACRNYLDECGNCLYLRRPAPRDLSHRIWERKHAQLPRNIHFVSCSNWLGNTARQSRLLRGYPLVSIPNPIDINVFSPMALPTRLAFRREAGIPDDSFVLLFVSVKVREERKGFRYLREALQILKNEQPDIRISLMVLGMADPGDLAALPYPCHPLGMVKDTALLAQAYGAADAFVIPSLEDNLPNTVMESLSCGTPVVGFNTGGIPEMVEHTQSGYIATQGDSRDLAKGFRWIIEGGQSLWDRLRRAARRKVESRYSNAVVAQQYIALYRNLLNR